MGNEVPLQVVIFGGISLQLTGDSTTVSKDPPTQYFKRNPYLDTSHTFFFFSDLNFIAQFLKNQKITKPGSCIVEKSQLANCGHSVWHAIHRLTRKTFNVHFFAQHEQIIISVVTHKTPVFLSPMRDLVIAWGECDVSKHQHC